VKKFASDAQKGQKKHILQSAWSSEWIYWYFYKICA